MPIEHRSNALSPIATADDLIAAVRSHGPGQQVKITYSRGGTSHATRLTLGTSAN